MILNKENMYIGSCCGNSFIILDCRDIKLDRQYKIDFSSKNIIKYGVDSALFLNNVKGFDVFIEIFEKDGSESESCGNGIILVSYLLGIKKGKIKLKNTDVIVKSSLKKQVLLMNIKFLHTEEIAGEKNCLFIKAGEPHIIYLIDDLNKMDLVKVGEKLQKQYLGGVNVDAIQKINEFRYLIKTYERGLFAETKSCGTGSLASYVAISHLNSRIYKKPIEFKSIGGSHWISRSGKMLQLKTLKKFCKIKAL
jgi:diaminopimelate epimerase